MSFLRWCHIAMCIVLADFIRFRKPRAIRIRNQTIIYLANRLSLNYAPPLSSSQDLPSLSLHAPRRHPMLHQGLSGGAVWLWRGQCSSRGCQGSSPSGRVTRRLQMPWRIAWSSSMCCRDYIRREKTWRFTSIGSK